MARDRTNLPDEFAPFQSAVVLRVYLNDTDDFNNQLKVILWNDKDKNH